MPVPIDRFWFYRLTKATGWPPRQVRAALESSDDPDGLCRLVRLTGWSFDEWSDAPVADGAWLVALDSEFGGER